LLTEEPTHPYRAVTGWTSQDKSMPVPEAEWLHPGAAMQRTSCWPRARTSCSVPFVWNSPNGVSIRRTFTVNRNEYAVKVQG
jgi:YidC/Oxa1 family membrane protein insertase